MSVDWSSAIEIAKGGTELVSVIVKLIRDALDGNEEAAAKLKRVDQVLTPRSPTEEAFDRAAEIAAGKPSRNDEPTRPTDPEGDGT